MTTLAQLESLLGTLPSDVVGHIHEYTKHPVAELFKVATRSGQILLRHPSIRRFPRAMGMSFTCHMAYLTSDDALFDSSFEAFEHWYYDNEEDLDDMDWLFFDNLFADLDDMRAEMHERRLDDE